MKNLFNKLGKVLSCLLLVVTLFTFSTNGVYASSESVTINRSYVMDAFIGDTKFPGLVTSDGTIVYCMEIDKEFVLSNTVYTQKGNADNGLLWIIKNSYPNKSITGSTERDQYITQSAIWWYLDDVNGTNKMSTSFKTTDKEAYIGDRNEMIKLVNGGKNHRNDTQNALTLSLNSNGDLSLNNTYYESNYITVNTNASEYTVSASGSKNIVIVNEKGAIQTKFNASDKFKVKVLASDIKGKTDISISVNVTGGKESVKTYVPSDNTYQSVVSTKIENESLSKNLSFTIIPISKPTCKVEDGKYYGKDGNVVDKDTYNKECNKTCVIEDGKYYGKDGNIVDKDTYNKECNKTCVIEDGKYYGKDGNIVDKDTYNKECNSIVVKVPNTSANVSESLIGLGIVLTVLGAGLIYHRKKQNI